MQSSGHEGETKTERKRCYCYDTRKTPDVTSAAKIRCRSTTLNFRVKKCLPGKCWQFAENLLPRYNATVMTGIESSRRSYLRQICTTFLASHGFLFIPYPENLSISTDKPRWQQGKVYLDDTCFLSHNMLAEASVTGNSESCFKPLKTNTNETKQLHLNTRNAEPICKNNELIETDTEFV